MKKNLISILLILLLSLVGISACKSDRADNDRDQQTVLALYLLNRTTEFRTTRNLCTEAVLIMNQCVGATRGFSAVTMCSDANLNTGTAADNSKVPPVAATTADQNYTTLISCVRGKVAEYNCNFTQNKVATAKSAYDSYFKACDVPSGIINSNMF